jgi:hypothetical protein
MKQLEVRGARFRSSRRRIGAECIAGVVVLSVHAERYRAAVACRTHALRGRKNVFQFGDPLNLGPQNNAATVGTMTGSGQTGYALATSSSGFTAGDWIQVGVRLYHVTSATRVSGG